MLPGLSSEILNFFFRQGLAVWLHHILEDACLSGIELSEDLCLLIWLLCLNNFRVGLLFGVQAFVKDWLCLDAHGMKLKLFISNSNLHYYY